MNETIKIVWTAQTRYSASFTADEARDRFGLGGTSDQELPARIALLTSTWPLLLAHLMDGPDYEEDESYELLAITDPRDGTQLYPKPERGPRSRLSMTRITTEQRTNDQDERY